MLKEGKLREMKFTSEKTGAVDKKYVIDFNDGTRSYQLYEGMELQITIGGEWIKGKLQFTEKHGYVFKGEHHFYSLKIGKIVKKELKFHRIYNHKKIKEELKKEIELVKAENL